MKGIFAEYSEKIISFLRCSYIFARVVSNTLKSFPLIRLFSCIMWIKIDLLLKYLLYTLTDEWWIKWIMSRIVLLSVFINAHNVLHCKTQTHTHTLACTHTRPHAHAHTHTQTHTHIYVCACVCVRVCVRAWKREGLLKCVMCMYVCMCQMRM